MADADTLKSYCLVCPSFEMGVFRLRPYENYVIGRDPRSRVHLASNTVSRRHALVLWVDTAGGGFMIEDLGSRNGVKVGDSKIRRVMLEDEDVVTIGAFKMRFRIMSGDLGMLMGDSTDDADETQGLTEETVSESRLAGRFSGTDLLEICQLVDVNQKTGMVEVSSEKLDGKICFQNGRVVHAEADGDLRDLDAVRAVLSLPEGRFRFHDQIDAKRLLKRPLSVKALLLELMAELDHGEIGPSRGGARPDGDPSRETGRFLLPSPDEFDPSTDTLDEGDDSF